MRRIFIRELLILLSFCFLALLAHAGNEPAAPEPTKNRTEKLAGELANRMRHVFYHAIDYYTAPLKESRSGNQRAIESFYQKSEALLLRYAVSDNDSILQKKEKGESLLREIQNLIHDFAPDETSVGPKTWYLIKLLQLQVNVLNTALLPSETPFPALEPLMTIGNLSGINPDFQNKVTEKFKERLLALENFVNQKVAASATIPFAKRPIVKAGTLLWENAVEGKQSFVKIGIYARSNTPPSCRLLLQSQN